MTTPCLVLPFEIADGAANMALDEALLDEVAEDPTHAVLRTYGWSSPTLSLGYFQKVADAEADPRRRGAPIVRRPTGGGAIWHHHEVTYTVVVPGDHALARHSVDLYRATHAAIADVLGTQGIAAGRRGGSPAASTRDRPFLCFTDRNAEDIVYRGFKLVGSSQRRRPNALLQHGSVLLARSDVDPGLPGVGDLSPVRTDVHHWSSLLLESLPAALGLVARPADIPGEARRRAEVLRREVYTAPSWTRRR
jgi:lipoate-protein ligase A